MKQLSIVAGQHVLHVQLALTESRIRMRQVLTAEEQPVMHAKLQQPALTESKIKMKLLLIAEGPSAKTAQLVVME